MTVGFNEAGAFLPRKLRRDDEDGGRRRGFNEAGAFLPRKRLRIAASGDGAMSFNEAGAFLPRKPHNRPNSGISTGALQ